MSQKHDRHKAAFQYFINHSIKGQYELRRSTKLNTSDEQIKELQKAIHQLCSRNNQPIFSAPQKYTYWKPQDINYLVYEIDNPDRLIGFLSMRPFEIKNEFDPQVGKFKWNNRELDSLKISDIAELSLICSHKDFHLGRTLMTLAKTIARAKSYKALFIELSQLNENALIGFYRKHGAKLIHPTQELISIDGIEVYDYPYNPRLEYWYNEFPLPPNIPKPTNKRRISKEMPMYLKKNMSKYMAIIKTGRKELVTLKDVKKLAALPPIPKDVYCGARSLPAGKRFGNAIECRRQARRFGLSKLNASQKRKINL